MADPLSITASIIAVIGAAEGVGKTLTKIRDIRNAPIELLALVNEVSDLRIILNNIQSHLHQTCETPQSSNYLHHMATLLQRAKDRLLQLDELIHYRLVKPSFTLEEIKVSRREWAKAKDTIASYRQSLRDIRLNLIAQMTVLNTHYQSHIGLTIEEIFIISNRLQTTQLQTEHQVLQQLSEHSSLLANITNAQIELRRLLRMPYKRTRQGSVSHGVGSDGPFIGIKMRSPSHKQSPCTKYCICTCHESRYFASPHLLYNVIGALFVGYSGYPQEAIRWCNKPNCKGQQAFRASFVYIFPLWFLNKALSVRLIAGAYSEIQISLKVTRIVPQGADIFRRARENDTSGLRWLFKQKLASPYDVDATGDTALHYAIEWNSLDTCKALLDEGADPGYRAYPTSSSVLDAVWIKIFDCNSNQTKFDTSRYRDLIPIDDDYIEERRLSKLHKIILGITSDSLVEELNVQGIHPDIDAVDSRGMTPLIWAARRCDNAHVDLLLKAGADPNIFDGTKMSALMHASQSSGLDCVEILLKAGANREQKPRYYSNALHYGTHYNSDVQVVRSLVEAGLDVNGRNTWGATPLCNSTFNDSHASAQFLLDHGAELDTLDHEGDSALHYSAWLHADKVMQLLLDHGASYTSPDSHGDYILHLVGKNGGLRSLEILQAANLQNINPEVLNREGKTALQVARDREGAEDGFAEEMQALLNDMRVRNAKSQATEDTIPKRTSNRNFPSPFRRVLRFNLALRRIESIIPPVWKSILIGWVLGFICAGVIYITIGRTGMS